MGEVIIVFLIFCCVIVVATMAYFALTRSARESKREGTVPRGWLREVERRDWSGQEEGVVTSGPPRVPPQAHVRSGEDIGGIV